LKNKIIILILLMATSVSAQIWGPPIKWNTGWVRSRIISADEGIFTIEINGGVPERELTDLGYSNLGSGNNQSGYFQFMGGAYKDSDIDASRSYLLCPRQPITSGNMNSDKNNMYNFKYSILCSTTESAADDFDHITEGFGFWKKKDRDKFNSQLYSGYLIGMTIAKRSLTQPSEINAPTRPINNIMFVDSLYKFYLGHKSLSSKLPMYIKARIHECDSAFALISVLEGPIFRFKLTPDSINPVIFRGKCDEFIDSNRDKIQPVVLEGEVYLKRK
jgi:hypothetical protein